MLSHSDVTRIKQNMNESGLFFFMSWEHDERERELGQIQPTPPPTRQRRGASQEKNPTLIGKSTQTLCLWATVKTHGAGSRSAHACEGQKKKRKMTHTNTARSLQHDGGLHQPNTRAAMNCVLGLGFASLRSRVKGSRVNLTVGLG